MQGIFGGPKSALYDARVSVSGGDSNIEITKLKADNQALQKKLIDYEKLKEDNQALRSQFEEGSVHNYKMLPAHIIGFVGSFGRPSALIIDQGERSNVKNGMAVVFGNNLVGKIGNSSENYAKVLLPEDPSFSIIAQSAESQSLGLVAGEEDFILFDRVSIKDKIVAGETVLTKGEADNSGDGIPADLVIGKIESIYRNESQPYQTAKVKSEVDTEHLSTVFVIVGF